MTKYNVPFEEKIIKVYVVEAKDRIQAAMQAGKLRATGVPPEFEHPLSERMLTVEKVIDEQLSTIERGAVNEAGAEAAKLIPPKHS